MKVLVTGGSGQLGSAMVQAFNSLGSVYAQSFSQQREGFCVCDLRDEGAVSALVGSLDPDLIVHTAAYRDPDFCELNVEESELLNYRATEYLLRVAPAKTRFIYSSSDYVFDGTQAPYSEEDVVHPVNRYGRQKVASEKRVLERPSSVVLRFPVLVSRPVTGEGYTGYVERLVSAVQRGEEVSLDAVSKRFPTSVEDVAGAARFLFERGLSGVYHVCSSEGETPYELSLRIGKRLNVPTDHLIPSTAPVRQAAPRPVDAHLSTEKLKKAGFTCSDTFFDFL